jgi:hypothetical protein
MLIDRPTLIELHHKGISLAQAKNIFHHNQPRYSAYLEKLKQPEKKGMVLFNAFVLDCRRAVCKSHVASYACHGDLA